jgi:predicted DNA-binding transcriptional regulator AlpA
LSGDPVAEQPKTKLLNTVTGGTLGAVDPMTSPAAETIDTSDASVDVADVRAPKSSGAPPLPLKRRPAGGVRAMRGPPSPAPIGRRFLSYDDLLERGIRFSRVHLRRLERTGDFPVHVELGTGNEVQTSVAWVAIEVEAWEDARIAKRDAKLRMKQSDASAPVA